MGSSESSPPPDLVLIKEALKAVTESGLPLTSESVPDILLQIDVVWARASDPFDRLSRLETLNRLLYENLEDWTGPTWAPAARTLLGIEPGIEAHEAELRRHLAAEATSESLEEATSRKYPAAPERVEEEIRRRLAWHLFRASQKSLSSPKEEVIRPLPLNEWEPPRGVLTDDDIISQATSGRLIVENFSSKHVQQTCYELRAGNIYYDLSNGAKRISLRDRTDDYVLLKPHQLAVVITKESLELPADVVGRILMKGKLFSLGLQPVNTYADPGFIGRLGIVVYNSSPNFIRIDQGAAIAKIEFERLRKPVSRPYSGQHGYQTEIWPIPTHMILEPSDAYRDPRVDELGKELSRSHGPEVANVIDRVFRYERALFLSVLAYTLLTFVIIVYGQASNNRLSTTVAFAIGLITNIVSAILIFAGTNLRRQRR